MERHPVFSVVIPAYNRAWCIERAVSSVFRQTFQDFEIVVTDDGSTDDTCARVEAITDPRVQLVRHATNRGMYEAQNSGILRSRGKLVVFLDSDDELIENALALVVAQEHRLVGSIGGLWGDRIDSETGQILGNVERLVGREVIDYDHLLCNLFLGDFLPVIRREVFDRVPYRMRSRFMTPVLWSKILREFSMVYLREPLCRMHRGGIDRRTRSRVRDAAGWVEGVNEYIDEFGADILARCPQKMGLLFRMRSMYQLAAGDRAGAIRSTIRSLRYRPEDWRVWALLPLASLPRALAGRVLFG